MPFALIKSDIVTAVGHPFPACVAMVAQNPRFMRGGEGFFFIEPEIA